LSYRSAAIHNFRQWNPVILPVAVVLILFSGCASHAPVYDRETALENFTRLGYSIQAGAFSDLNNAVRLTESLQATGLDAYYFVHTSGLYKVRFGNFPTYKKAFLQAQTLNRQHIIAEYYIVSPDESAAGKRKTLGETYLRNQLVKTSRSFIGIPYRWGGTSASKGFDCSGLTMAVYHLNGLNLPRTSKEQSCSGIAIRKYQLKKGDLVFFATTGSRRVSHVGIYIGRNQFIHAPGRGKNIRMESLANGYYLKRYAGARTYIR